MLAHACEAGKVQVKGVLVAIAHAIVASMAATRLAAGQVAQSAALCDPFASIAVW